MRHFIQYLVRLILLIAFSSSVGAAGDDEKALATQALSDYLNGFVSLDAQRVGGLGHEPFMFISSGRTSMLSTHADIESWIKPIFADLKQRGYGRSEWPQLQVKLLTKDIAVASALIVRYKTDGAEMERFGATYLLRKTADGWRIAVFARHDASSVLKLD